MSDEKKDIPEIAESAAVPKFQVGQVVMMISIKKQQPFKIVGRIMEFGSWFYQWNSKNAADEHMIRELTPEEIGVSAPLEAVPVSQPRGPFHDEVCGKEFTINEINGHVQPSAEDVAKLVAAATARNDYVYLPAAKFEEKYPQYKYVVRPLKIDEDLNSALAPWMTNIPSANVRQIIS